jgi:DNA-binding transcriptional LysR family regulator
MNNALSPLDRFGGVRAFVAVADRGSFNAAAETLGLSPSAVSKAVSRLEDRLQVRLFQRTTRRIQLTEAGLRFYERSSKALQDLIEAEAELSYGRDKPVGLLRIDLPILFGRRWMLPLLLELNERHPDLELDISFNLEATDIFASGIDMVVRIGALHDSSGLSAKSLGLQHRVLCATPDYLDRWGRPSALSDLHNHACLAETRRGRVQPWPYRLSDTEFDNFMPRTRFRIGSTEALAEAIRGGRGIGMLPHWFVSEEIKAGKLEPVLPSLFCPSLPINLLWARSPHVSPKVRAVIDAVKEWYGTEYPWDEGGIEAWVQLQDQTPRTAS